MRQLKLKPYLNGEEIKEILDNQKDIRSFKNWQIIYAIYNNSGKKAEEISSILGVTKRKIYSVVEQYNKMGKEWNSNKKWGGRREKSSYMSIKEEEELLLSLTNKALSGKILTYKDIKDEIRKRIKRDFSDDYVWSLFKRHGWSKKVPRPKHPLSNLEEQEKLKKTFRKSWQP